jgi:hypothetical protein
MVGGENRRENALSARVPKNQSTAIVATKTLEGGKVGAEATLGADAILQPLDKHGTKRFDLPPTAASLTVATGLKPCSARVAWAWSTRSPISSTPTDP